MFHVTHFLGCYKGPCMQLFTIFLMISTHLLASSPVKIYSVFGKTYAVLETDENYSETGIASWYGEKFHGNPTSSGIIYDMNQISVAHKTLPLGSWVKVTNLENGRHLKAQVIDRGPFIKNRLIDLSLAAAKELHIVEQGTSRVHVTSLRTSKIADNKTFKVQLGAFKYLKSAKDTKRQVSRQPGFKDISFSIEKKNQLYRLFATIPIGLQSDFKSWTHANHLPYFKVKSGI